MRFMLTAVAGAMLLAMPAAADDWDFILTNDSGKEIKKVELSPTGAGNWQESKRDTEGRKSTTVKNGARMTVQFDKGDDICRYDVRATFTDDSMGVWTAINVCDNAFVTVRYRDGNPVFAAN